MPRKKKTGNKRDAKVRGHWKTVRIGPKDGGEVATIWVEKYQRKQDEWELLQQKKKLEEKKARAEERKKRQEAQPPPSQPSPEMMGASLAQIIMAFVGTLRPDWGEEKKAAFLQAVLTGDCPKEHRFEVMDLLHRWKTSI